MTVVAGKDVNGDIIQRTEPEERLFRQILPSMPLLYATFNVCIFSEVVDQVTPYQDSGWCFAEMTIATLSRQLMFFSPEFDFLKSASAAGRRLSSDSCLDEVREKMFSSDSFDVSCSAAWLGAELSQLLLLLLISGYPHSL